MLVEELQQTIGHYVVVSDEQRLIIALWVVHTYIAAALEQTPYLSVTSPEKQCGKSRLLELLELLVARPWLTFDASPATLYRKISAETPTLLLDEVDAIFSVKQDSERYQALRGIINSGHRKGATVSRAANFGNDLQDFRVYCPKVLSGIGALPDTIADRSIPIRLKRKTQAEHVERFRRRDVEAATAPLREQMQAWAEANAVAVAADRPPLPAELTDRMQEGCEGLIAIADRLGCGDQARAALVSLLTAEREDSEETHQVRLLSDIRDMFNRTKKSAHLTRTILSSLADEWEHIGSRRVARLLKPYGIASKSVREGDEVGKGYHREDFADAWSRYLPPAEPEAEPELDVSEAPAAEQAVLEPV